MQVTPSKVAVGRRACVAAHLFLHSALPATGPGLVQPGYLPSYVLLAVLFVEPLLGRPRQRQHSLTQLDLQTPAASRIFAAQARSLRKKPAGGSAAWYRSPQSQCGAFTASQCLAIPLAALGRYQPREGPC